MINRRLKIVHKAYFNVDKQRTGQITIKDLQNIFDVTMDQEFLSGKKRKLKLFNEFIYNHHQHN